METKHKPKPAEGSKPDPLIEYKQVVIGGAIYYLAFDINAIIEAHKETGINLFGVLSAGPLSIENTRFLIYVAFKSAHPDMTLPRVNAMLSNIPTYTRLGNTMLEAYGLSIEDPPEAGAGS